MCPLHNVCLMATRPGLGHVEQSELLETFVRQRVLHSWRLAQFPRRRMPSEERLRRRFRLHAEAAQVTVDVATVSPLTNLQRTETTTQVRVALVRGAVLLW